MFMVVTAAMGLYLAAALLRRLPRLVNLTLGTMIAAALIYRDERCGVRLWSFAAAGGGWARNTSAQRSLNRATRSAISLTVHATSAPRATHLAVEFMRQARLG